MRHGRGVAIGGTQRLQSRDDDLFHGEIVVRVLTDVAQRSHNATCSVGRDNDNHVRDAQVVGMFVQEPHEPCVQSCDEGPVAEVVVVRDTDHDRERDVDGGRGAIQETFHV